MASYLMKGKAKAKNSQRRYLDAPEEEGSDDAPSTPPPTTDDLIANLDSLSLSPERTFVGGFHPAYAADSQAYYYGLGTTFGADQPISMPIPCVAPHSLTVQQALRPPPSSISAGRAHSDPFSAPPVRHSISARSSTAPPEGSTSAPSTPFKNASSRLAPDTYPRSPSHSSGHQQCAGRTLKDKRCLNKVPRALLTFDCEDDSAAIPLYCYHHKRKVLDPTGFYSPKAGLIVTWVEFEDWIPAYLQPETKASLRAEMDKPPSRSDNVGYIYTFEIRDPTEKKTIKLKVGRTVHLVKRMDQWSKQCGSKEQVLRGFYPNTVEPDEDGNEGSLMKGRIKGGEKGPWCQRLERLIHLELADLACHRVYLEPEWPHINTPPAPADVVSSSAAAACRDCGSKHKEIFEFKRWKKGDHEGKEWEELVEPVIQRWGKFVELYV